MSLRTGAALAHMVEAAEVGGILLSKVYGPLREGGRQKWKCWSSLNDVLRLRSSCSFCVYARGHSMKSLEKRGFDGSRVCEVWAV